MNPQLSGMLARTDGEVSEWPVELDVRGAEAHLICTSCRQSVLRLAADVAAAAAVVSVQIITAAVTRHYREAHCHGGGLPL